MNDLLDEWREDLLGGAIIFILGYLRKNNVPIPQYNHLKRMSDRIHSLINEFNTSTDDNLQPDKKPKTDGDFTEPYRIRFISNLCNSVRYIDGDPRSLDQILRLSSMLYLKNDSVSL